MPRKPVLNLDCRRPILVGLAGYAGVGKNTVANAMGGAGVVQKAFAAQLKRQVQDLARHAGLDLGVPSDKEIMRPILVEWGRITRRLRPDYWIKASPYDREVRRTVYTDVRYLNEAMHILNNGGIVFYLTQEGVGPANDEEDVSIREMLSQTPPETVIGVDNTPRDNGLSAATDIKAIIKAQLGEDW